MRYLITLIAILVLTSSIWGQTSKKKRKKNMDFPRLLETTFDLEGGLIFISGDTSDQNIDQYLLDTGAPTLILNQPEQARQSIGNVVSLSGSSAVGNKRVKDFEMQGMKLGDISSYTTDLTPLEKVKKKVIRGILGYKVFRHLELFIDYQKRKLMLFEQGASDLHALVQPKEELKFYQRGHFPIIKVKIGKRSYFFGIDTGAEVNVMDSRWKNRMKRKQVKGWSEKRVQGLDKKVVRMQSCKIAETKVGEQSYNNMEFVFADLSSLSHCTNFELDGILGYPFLSSGKFSINYQKKRFYVWNDPLSEVEEVLLSLKAK